MIAITGANGHLGKLTLQQLLQRTAPAQLVAVVRDPAKMGEFKDSGIHIRTADYDNPESLRAAFKGVDKVVQISAAVTGEDGIRHERNVVEAAHAQGVRHIIYTSTVKPSAAAHFVGTQQGVHTEKAIRDTGMQYTFFRDNLYMETIPLLIGNAMQNGQIFYPGGQARIGFASRGDIAAALANVATTTGHENQTYEITGSQACSFEDIAQALRAAKGLAASYTNVPEDAYRAELVNAGLPEGEIDFVISLARGISAGEFSHTDSTLETLLGRKPLTVQEYLKNA